VESTGRSAASCRDERAIEWDCKGNAPAKDTPKAKPCSASPRSGLMGCTPPHPLSGRWWGGWGGELARRERRRHVGGAPGLGLAVEVGAAGPRVLRPPLPRLRVGPTGPVIHPSIHPSSRQPWITCPSCMGGPARGPWPPHTWGRGRGSSNSTLTVTAGRTYPVAGSSARGTGAHRG